MEDKDKNRITIRGVAFIKNKMQTNMMQWADLFNSFKVVAEPIELGYVIQVHDGVELKDVDTNTLNLFEMGLEMAKNEFADRLVVCHIQSVEFDDVIYKNKKILPYVCRDVSVISDGKKFGLVVDIVKKMCPGVKIHEGDVRKIKYLEWDN